IVGAGQAGQLLAWRLQSQKEGETYQVVGFADDDPAKEGMQVHGRPVLGGRGAIPRLVAERRVDLIVIAIHNIAGDDFRQLLGICQSSGARVKILPALSELMAGQAPAMRDVAAEDLLGRHPVQIDHGACRALLAGRSVLVTGAAGSIGAELCRQVAGFGPQRLLLLDNNESGLHDLAVELGATQQGVPFCPLVADVTNRAKVEALFARYRPQVVFHAAAYKHVPLMEEHPDEAVRINVLGTLNAIELACAHGAERFVFISTDKAVNPSSVMGATKRLGELLVAAHAGRSGTLCTGVRFGNVLGSRGSVVPIFERQIAAGGPVTVTHPEMTRFFMSIPEAVSLVIQAAALTQGGDLFVLDMGEQMRIVDLAERLIRLRGLRPGVDIPIVYTGIRPGEKMHEELTGSGDERGPTSHPAISRVNGTHRVEREALLAQVEELARLAREPERELLTARLWQVIRSASPQPAAARP
ncbi:MAG: nucleoside-diphosphate sugar epimerase/dehydratase, partial [Anaerolineae bacterium]|nr:nucleoside-diphosphate sugar epimerase/dehydratase [Anaerolineae bacterium]